VRTMRLRPLPMLSVVVLLMSTLRCYSSPCSADLVRVQGQIDAKLDALAGGGPTARESVPAIMHRQPTPTSIASAEMRIGDLSPATLDTISVAMARAQGGGLRRRGCLRAGSARCASYH
jgi:hypothetical protein